MIAKSGRSFWFDLPAAVPHDAMAFYEGLFGWTYKRLSDPIIENYWVIEKDGDLIGGIRQSDAPRSRGKDAEAPVLYFTVDHLGESIQRARDLGAQLVGERVEMGKHRGCYQWIRDRQGNLVALWANE